jgi:O-antigen ligase
LPAKLTLAYTLIAVLFMVALFLTGSRAGVGSFLLGMIVVASVFFFKNKKIFYVFISGLIIVVSLSAVFKASVFVEFSKKMQSDGLLADRIELWKYAYAAGRENIWFGLGTGNYQNISNEQIETWVQDRGWPEFFDQNDHRWHSHAHNIYLQVFVDRGILGILGLVLFFVMWLATLLYGLKSIPQAQAANEVIMLSSLCVIVVLNSMGMVINTFHHEPAMLASLLFGLAINQLNTVERKNHQRQGFNQ